MKKYVIKVASTTNKAVPIGTYVSESVVCHSSYEYVDVITLNKLTSASSGKGIDILNVSGTRELSVSKHFEVVRPYFWLFALYGFLEG